MPQAPPLTGGNGHIGLCGRFRRGTHVQAAVFQRSRVQQGIGIAAVAAVLDEYGLVQLGGIIHPEGLLGTQNRVGIGVLDGDVLRLRPAVEIVRLSAVQPAEAA